MTAFSVDTFAALVVFVVFTLLAGIMSAVGNVLFVLLALAGAGFSAAKFLGSGLVNNRRPADLFDNV